MTGPRPDSTAPQPGTEEPPLPLVWDRPPPDRRAPLSREIIVSTAIPLADSEGLAALTVRRLAAELDARPMSVYSYARITSKEELFDLMLDQVCAEMIVADLPTDWQEALRAIAIRLRAVLRRHPWWVELVGHNVLLGPNGTRHREQTLAALSGTRVDPATKLAIIVAVETYVVGQAMFAMDEEGSLRVPGRTAEQWQEAVGHYQATLIASGDFPNLAAIGLAHPSPQQDRERYFLLGLDWLLHGVAATLEPQPKEVANTNET